ncbi:MAG: alpha-1,4-glucan--maltose-1-phosphate maltosyltransferase, partial [Mycobacteriaceae bacterium]
MTGRLGIDDVVPVVSHGAHPAKAVVGEVVPIAATVWREGHDAVAATLVWRGPGERTGALQVPMVPGTEPDRFHALVTADTPGLWTFRVDAWSDPVATWRHAVEAKAGVGQSAQEMANDLETGALLMERAATVVAKDGRSQVLAAAAALRGQGTVAQRLAPALSSEVGELLRRRPVRELLTRGRPHQVWVDRTRASFGSWYELFPRSTGGWDADGRPVHGSFTTALDALPRVADMGFDVVYLPPIHPIGEVNRKGPNNTLTPGPDDVGSPWAIGSVDGGHDAVHPRLGTLDDFDTFVARVGELGMEVALDLALQAAPDHPWAAEHPEWFTVLPDGSIAYAENPPKKYQDIYPVNFDNDREGIYAEVLRVVRHWMSHGVRIFRVDNPHTKPPDFWAWLIAEVRKTDPDVLFLAEAFTRPARLYGLARLGFTQSYSYFTWRTAKWELTEFGEELVAHADEARFNLFVNTPDILHESLQHGGPGTFAVRAALAATLAPSWGVYSGFELYEGTPVREGSEEYLDTEKFQLRPRDFAGALERGESLEPYLRRLNEVRRAHPALQQQRTLRFHHVDNDALIAYSKVDPTTGDAVLVVVNLNAFGPEQGTVHLDMPALGRDWQDRFWVRDEITADRYEWGEANFVRLEP